MILILLAAAAAVFSYFDGVFRVRVIRVEGLPKSYDLYGLETLKNAPSLFLTENEISRTIMEANPGLATASAVKRLPDTVIIQARTAKPFVYLQVDGGFYVLDGEGKIISKVKGDLPQEDLPVIRYFQKFPYALMQPGESLDFKDLKMALVFVAKTQGLGLAVNSVDIDGVDVIGLNLNRKAILFSSEKDVDFQEYELEQVVRQFRVQGKDFKKLDLRFNKPVLELTE